MVAFSALPFARNIVLHHLDTQQIHHMILLPQDIFDE